MVNKGVLENPEVVGEDEGVRWYYVPAVGKYVPSVTSVLDRGFPKNPGLIKWFINSTAEDIDKKSLEGRTKGTEAHDVIERCIKVGVDGKPNFRILNKQERVLIKGFINWYEANDVVFLGQEEAVYYCEDGVETAGRYDALAEVNGVKMVMDWKRSKAIYETYPPQGALYADALGIPDFGILRLCEKNKCAYQFKSYKTEEHLPAFKAAFHLASYLGIMKKRPEKDSG